MTDALVRTDRDAGVATITLDRPRQLNALDEPLRMALLAALRDAAGDGHMAAIVLTGAGRAFCVGQDLTAADELADCDDCVRRTYNPLVEQIVTMPKPVIAAVNGPAVGAGMGFALACDMVLMSEESFLSCAFGKVGLVPDSGTSYFLARALGHRRAFEIAASGRRIGADEAVDLGLANRAVRAGALLDEAQAVARMLAQASPKAIGLTKQLLHAALSGSLNEVLSIEALSQGVAGSTPAHVALREGFLRKGR